jgi:MFS family permease
MSTDRELHSQPTANSLPRPVWILSWVSFFADISSEMVYPLLPIFLIGVLGSSKTQLGAMEGGAVLLVSLMSAVAGIRSDRKGSNGGRVGWIRMGYGLPVIGKAMIALATTWPWAIGGRFLDRFGKGLRGAPRDELIADAVLPDQRGSAFGLHRAFDTAGAILGVLISAWLLWWLTGSPQADVDAATMGQALETPAWVYRFIFGVGSIMGLASLGLTFLVSESKPVGIHAESTSAEPSTSKDNANPPMGVRHGWKSLPAAYWKVLSILILFSLANSSDTFLLLRARDLGYSPWAVVLVYALYNVTYSALSYPAGKWSDRIGRWRIIMAGWLIYIVVYAGFAWLPASQAWGMWPLMAVYGVYMALTDGVAKALVADHAPQASRGAAMGIFYALTGLTTFVASLLTGIVWDRWGGSIALLVSACFALIALLGILLMGKRVRINT